MANLIQTISTAAGILKNYYQGPLMSQFNDDCMLYNGAEIEKYSWAGGQINRPLKLRRNPGVGAGSDGGTLPKIGRQTTAQAVILPKFNWLRWGVTAGVLESTKNDLGSFVRIQALEMEEGYKDLRSSCNRQLGWDGTGTLALMNANVSGSTTAVFKGRESTEEALKFLDVGYTVDIVTSAGVVEASGVTINSITSGGPSSSTATVVLDTAVTVTANSLVVMSGSYNKEVQGVLTALDAGTSSIYGIDRSVYIQYQGTAITNSGLQLNLDYLQRLHNTGIQRGAGEYAAIYSDQASERMYQKLLIADKRYVNQVEGDGSFSKKGKMYASFAGIPWVVDKDFPTRILFVPKKGCFSKAILAEMSFADEQGTAYIAQTEVDAYEVRIRHFFNMFNAQPGATPLGYSYISP